MPATSALPVIRSGRFLALISSQANRCAKCQHCPTHRRPDDELGGLHVNLDLAII
jgi:hypothetical protein